MYSIILYISIFLLICILYKCYRTTRYFSQWGIPQVRELPYIGSIALTFYPRVRHINYALIDVYNNTNREAKYLGAFMSGTPIIYIRDLELVKAILVKNFDHFSDRKTFVDEKVDPLFGKNLNFLNGERWKLIRNTLSPAFTSSKMRQMFVLMRKAADNFATEFVKRFEDAKEMDMKDAVSKYTCDVIATCAFGIEIDSLKNPDNEFYKHGMKSTIFRGFVMVKLMFEMLFPTLSRKLRNRIIPKDTTDFFLRVIDETIKSREARGIERPDMLQLMMEARKTNDFDILEITAQAFLFFLAGFEATNVQSCLLFQEIAANPEIQKKVQKEVDYVMRNGEASYEDINNHMPYLDATLSETLRVHAIAHVNRRCNKEFELPPAVPGAKPFIIKPGMDVMIPVCGIHMDPDLYGNPEKFDPDRFIGKKIMTADISNLGFGLGPRMCIGNRFAVLEIKTLLVHLFAKCSLEPCGKTCLPMEYDWTAFAPIPKGGFWLKVKSKD